MQFNQQRKEYISIPRNIQDPRPKNHDKSMDKASEIIDPPP